MKFGYVPTSSRGFLKVVLQDNRMSSELKKRLTNSNLSKVLLCNHILWHSRENWSSSTFKNEWMDLKTLHTSHKLQVMTFVVFTVSHTTLISTARLNILARKLYQISIILLNLIIIFISHACGWNRNASFLMDKCYQNICTHMLF